MEISRGGIEGGIVGPQRVSMGDAELAGELIVGDLCKRVLIDLIRSRRIGTDELQRLVGRHLIETPRSPVLRALGELFPTRGRDAMLAAFDVLERDLPGSVNTGGGR